MPDNPPFTDANRHFDNYHFTGGMGYVNGCWVDLRKHLCNVDKNKDECEYVLNEFGQLLHTVQDFYSHSNYVELKLKTDDQLLPQQMPLVDWHTLAASNQLRTGFFYYT